MATPNSHYERLLNGLLDGKDSIFEPCKIIEYKPEKMMARVFFLNSKQYRDDVLILFPALFLNTGVICPPVKDSTGIAFWGAEKIPYVIPAQFMMPKMNTENGVTKPNASPGQVDEVFDLRNVESGEVLLKCLGGSFFHLKNVGEIEWGTPKLHRISLFEEDGLLETVVERTRTYAGGFYSYNGPYMGAGNDESTDHHISIELDDQTVDWSAAGDLDDKELLNNILSGGTDGGVTNAPDPIWHLQAGNVFENGQKKISEVDNSEVFIQSKLYERVPVEGDSKNKELRSVIELTKKGSVHLLSKEGVNETSIALSSGQVEVATTGSARVKGNGVEVLLTADGDVEYKMGEKTYSFKNILSRINELSIANGMPEL